MTPMPLNQGASCNTHPSTYNSNKFTSKIDWLAFTFTNLKDPKTLTNYHEILDSLYYRMDIELKGGKGYTKRYTYDNMITFYYDGQYSMGCHIEITGSGCRYFETLLEQSDTNWSEFLKIMLHYGADITRLDLAIDEKIVAGSNEKPSLNLTTIQRSLENHNFKAKSRKYAIYKSGDNAKDYEGLTVAVGSRKSNCYIRFYDKKAEQLNRMNEDAKQFEYWQRYEIELKKDFAQHVTQLIVTGKDIGTIVKGVLSDRLLFLNPNTGYPEIWWMSFLDNVQALQLQTEPREQTLGTLRQWVLKNVSKAFYVLYLEEGDQFIDTLLFEGKLKLMTERQAGIYKDYMIREEEPQKDIIILDDIDLDELIEQTEMKEDKANGTTNSD